MKLGVRRDPLATESASARLAAALQTLDERSAAVLECEARLARIRSQLAADDLALHHAEVRHAAGEGSADDVERRRASVTEGRQQERQGRIDLEEATRQRTIHQASTLHLRLTAKREEAATLGAEYTAAVLAFAERLAATLEANDELAALWQRIEAAFPRSDDVRHAAGVPVNLGLEDLALGELLHHPYSAYGGRVGAWQRRALEVLGADHAEAINRLGHLQRGEGVGGEIARRRAAR